MTMIFENKETAEAAVTIVGNTKACIHHEIEVITDETAQSLIKALQSQPTSGRRWCMCRKLDSIARDGFSTCGICGGRDAYGTSIERPPVYSKLVDTIEPTVRHNECS